MPFEAKYANPDVDRLYEAILSLKTKEECYRFFDDLCTIKEIQDMSTRLKVACLLHQKVSLQIIQTQVSASTSTIGRVNRSLRYGADGYEIIFNRIQKPTVRP
jgi:TrpR-related protein YerC/YecD